VNDKKAQDDGLKGNEMNIGYGGVQTAQRISTLCKDSISNCNTRRSNVAFVGAEYPHHFPIGSEGPVDMLPEEREFHRNRDQGEEYVWKSDSQIWKLLKQVQISNIAPMIEEDADIAGIQNADRTNRYKLPTDRLRYLALHYGVDLAKKK